MKEKKGFAAMSPEQHAAIAREGGRAAHEKGTAHEWTPEEARAAGRAGGLVVGSDPAHMSEIGKRGGRRAGELRRLRRLIEWPDEPHAFAAALTRAREALGLTMLDLAQRSSVPLYMIHKIEAGRETALSPYRREKLLHAIRQARKEQAANPVKDAP